MKGFVYILLEIVGILLVAVIAIYWFELDSWALRKIEPLFRRFASKVE